MTFAAVRHYGVFRVTEMCVRQPAFDHDRFRDLRRRIGNASGLFHFMAKSAAGVFRAVARVTSLRRFVGINGEKNAALQFLRIRKLREQLPHLLDGEFVDFRFVGEAAFASRELGVLGGQRAQKCADKLRVAVRKLEIRILHIELQRVTFLAMRLEADRLHVPAVRLRLMAVVAVELARFGRRNVAAVQMTLMIETQHVVVTHIFPLQLK